MSGGHFNYQNDRACEEVFDWDVSPDYGMGDKSYHKHVNVARRMNPLEDVILSELVYDVFCLLHSCDWYKSGDTGEETYLKDVAYFKAKWLGTPVQDIVNREINAACEDLKIRLKKELVWTQET